MTNKTENIFKMTKSEFKDYQLRLAGWHFKVNFLKKEIERLGNIKNLPIFQISAFLLKTQVIEFEVKQLITSLDLEIAINLRKSNSKTIRKIRYPKDFDDKTLGQTLNSFYQFDGIVTNKLKGDLKSLNTLRNKFTHHMFDNDKDYETLIDDAKKGVMLADQIISQIDLLNETINEFWKEAKSKVQNDKK